MTANTNDAAGTALPLPGLEADNLLAFLALLGLLRALETAVPELNPRVAWNGKPLVAHLCLTTPVSKQELVASADRGIRTLGQSYCFDRVDLTYSPAEFREQAREAQTNRERALLIAALASDGALRRRDEDTVEPTALCAMFGQGHQHFLARLSAMATRDHPANADNLVQALFEPWRYDDETDGFRWDPIEDRRYAHQFGDPSNGRNKIGTVTGANRLAAIGFAVLTSAPTNSGLVTLAVAGDRRERDICWPLVSVPTSLSGHVALLAHPSLTEEDQQLAPIRTYGIAAIARARRYQVGKFFNFERARLQALL